MGNQASFTPAFIWLCELSSWELCYVLISSPAGYVPCEVISVSVLVPWENVANIVSRLLCVSQEKNILQEYLLSMTTDEQLLNHTAMVRLLHLVCSSFINIPVSGSDP